MTSAELAGTAGPHVFVESLDAMELDQDDLGHLVKSLRMRVGDRLTVSDGHGRWRSATLGSGHVLNVEGDIIVVPEPVRRTTVAFSLVKGSKPELVIQKLTELGVDQLVVLDADRSVVKWDVEKLDRTLERWRRIIREASMQSHRVRLPRVEALVPALDWIARPEVAIAHFGGDAIGDRHTSIAIGPEGGWSDREVAASHAAVSLGATVLRAETAAIAAGVLLTALDGEPASYGR